MTWSIIARDPATGHFGIAVATKFFAVGARVPHIAAGIGGVATQALVNPYYGIDGVKLLREGRAPARHRRTPDRGRYRPRAAGNSTSWTPAAGSPRIPGANASTGAGTSRATAFRSPATCWRAPRVLDDTAKAYVANETLPFAQRLIAAMSAGEAAGGDKRGKQSAALLIHGEEEWSDARPARRRSCRSARRARTTGTGQPRALGAFPAVPADAQGIRRGLPTAPPSMLVSPLQSRARRDDDATPPIDTVDDEPRHCEEPPGRANARPMTGSARKLSRATYATLLRLARNDGSRTTARPPAER